FAPGGPIDVLGRLLQGPMAEALGQPVIVENVSGGAGMIGSNRVRQAAPDGYQIVLGSIGTNTLSPHLAQKPPYNPATDFAPVILAAEIPLVLIVRNDFPAQNLQEFIAYVKANHARLQYGSGGTAPRRTSPACCSARRWASTSPTCRTAAAVRPSPTCSPAGSTISATTSSSPCRRRAAAGRGRWRSSRASARRPFPRCRPPPSGGSTASAPTPGTRCSRPRARRAR